MNEAVISSNKEASAIRAGIAVFINQAVVRIQHISSSTLWIRWIHQTVPKSSKEFQKVLKRWKWRNVAWIKIQLATGCHTDWQREVGPSARFGIQNRGNIMVHTAYEYVFFMCCTICIHKINRHELLNSWDSISILSHTLWICFNAIFFYCWDPDLEIHRLIPIKYWNHPGVINYTYFIWGINILSLI